MKRKADLDQMRKQLEDELSQHQNRPIKEPKKKKKKFQLPSKEELAAEKKEFYPNKEERILANKSPSLAKLIANTAKSLNKSKITLEQFISYVQDNVPKEFEAVVKVEYSRYRAQTESKSPNMVAQFIKNEIKAYNSKATQFQHELAKSGKTVLVEGRDDEQIAELRNMLETILNQPGDDLSADRERNIAKSILGNDVKTAGILDSLKTKERKPKEEIDYKSKEDFAPDQLKKMEEDLLKRMEEQSMPLNFPGWKGTTPTGVVYTLSRPQLNMITFLYENALIRMKGEDPSQVRREKRKQENEQEEQENQKQNAIRKKLREKTKRKDEPAPLLDDDDLDDLDLDLEGFGKSARINSIKSLIKSARNIIKRIKI